MASITGRIANFVSRNMPRLARAGGDRHVERFRASQGHKFNKFMGKPVVLVDVVGRKSGKSQPVMLMLVRRGDDLLVCGSFGGNPRTPGWYENLAAAREAFVELDGARWAVTHRELKEGPEREACWNLLTEAYPDFASYQQLTTRRLPLGVLSRKAS